MRHIGTQPDRHHYVQHPYVGLLNLGGALSNVGVAPGPMSLNGGLLVGHKAVTGSMIGGIEITQEMLDFCAAHGIGSEVEVIPATYINEAYQRVLASDVRYRFVIDAALSPPDRRARQPQRGFRSMPMGSSGASPIRCPNQGKVLHKGGFDEQHPRYSLR